MQTGLQTTQSRYSKRRRRQTERAGNGEKERGISPRPVLRQRSASLPRHGPETDMSMFGYMHMFEILCGIRTVWRLTLLMYAKEIFFNAYK